MDPGVMLGFGNAPFGVAHQLELKDGRQLRKLKLKRLDVDGVNGDQAKVVHAVNCSNLVVEDVLIHVGDNPAAGLLTQSTNPTGGGSGRPNGVSTARAGGYFSGGSNNVFRRIGGAGKGRGNILVFANMLNSLFEDLYAYDLEYSFPDALDDMLEAVLFQTCSGSRIVRPTIMRLKGDPANRDPRSFTRCLVFSGCQDMETWSPRLSDADELLDHTGSLGNHRCHTFGGFLDLALNWGTRTPARARTATSSARRSPTAAQAC